MLVTLDGVRKAFPRVARRADRLRALGRLLLGQAPADPVIVLDQIDLHVRRGESLGIIGENGAGKSTLLKVLTGVLAPSAGSVRVNGTIAALLELGAGFHPEFTGRENIAMAGALMGFGPAQLRDKLDDILAFADIGRYIDEPVKHYSSGMVVRLGFALVAARRPDLLITDEVLAVGDEAFQRKCIRWIEDYLGQGGTLLLVSHSMYHVQKLCQRACWIHGGRVRAIGQAHEVTQAYLAYQETRVAQEETGVRAAGITQEFHVAELALNGQSAEAPPQVIEQGGDLTVSLTLATRAGRVPVAGIGVIRADGTALYGVSSEMDRARPAHVDATSVRYELVFDHTLLLPGTYFVRAHAIDPEGLRVFDTLERGFVVRGRTMELGLVRLSHQWRHGA